MKFPQFLLVAFLAAQPFCAAHARTPEARWSLGVYGGRFYDSSPNYLLTLRETHFEDHHILAVNATGVLWQAGRWPLSLVLDVVVARQFGQADLTELATAPTLHWSGFPWNDHLQTRVGFGPFGVSRLSGVSPLEKTGKGGSRWLNFLVLEVAFALPRWPRNELFVRLHHRCDVLGLLNDYGMNGEDFLVVGYRRRF